MADSFFGFNTTLDEIEDGGAFDPSEDEYDALNDETFGEMVDDGDWEQQHEEFSLLTESSKHMDIEESLSNLMIDNDDDLLSQSSKNTLSNDNIEPLKPHMSLLPSLVHPSLLPSMSSLSSMKNVCTVEELERSLRQQQQPQMQQMQNQHPQQQKPHMLPFFQPRFPSGLMAQPPVPLMGTQPFVGHPPGPPYRFAQPPPNHLSQHPYGNFNMMPPNNLPPGNIPPRPPIVPGMEAQNVFQQLQFNQQPNNFNHQNNTNQRFPLNSQPMPHNKQQFPPNQQQFLPNQPFPHNQHFPPNQQFPLNQQQIPLNQQQLPLNQPPLPLNQQHGNTPQQLPQTLQHSPLSQQRLNQNSVRNHGNVNQQPNMHQGLKPVNVNMNSNNNRPYPNVYNNSNGPNNKAHNDTNNLIQMIQNTHPMLQNNLHTGYMNAIANSILARGMLQRHPNNVAPGFNNQQRGGNENRRQVLDADPYSGLMTAREKQWLLNIQLMQLNTGTPYIDDFYYTVFLERKAKKQKEEVKEAHKVNQENHPFSQQNLANNRYNQYNNHGSGGQGGGEDRRERCNSTRSNSDNPPPNKDGPRTYVPTQFENSLGKLQCGSVTAPRKIIDMEVIGSESPTGESRSNAIGGSTAGVIGAPRGTRHILLAIETLYRTLLRLEDLSEPLAIANAVILKEREEKQKALLIEQQQIETKEKHDDEDDTNSSNEPANNFLRDIENVQKQNSNRNTHSSNNSTSSTNVLASNITTSVLPNLLDENKPDLLGKLFAGLLFEDRLSAFMNIRKGKTLVLRILTQAVPTERWRAPLGRVWPRLLRALPHAIRRDGNVLLPLMEHFQQYLNGTEGWAPVSDLCLMLSEGSPSGPTPQRAPSVPLRSATPSLPQRSLMHFIMSTTLGLSLLVALMERASVLPKPPPAAWNNMIKCAARLVPVSGNARPSYPVSRSMLAAHAAAADLPTPTEDSLAEILSQS